MVGGLSGDFLSGLLGFGCGIWIWITDFEGWHSVQFNFIHTVDRGEGEERIEVC